MKIFQIINEVLLTGLLAVFLSSCAGAYANSTSGSSNTAASGVGASAAVSSAAKGSGSISSAEGPATANSSDTSDKDSNAGDSSASASDYASAASIKLNGSTVSCTGTGVFANGSIVTISSAGTYIIVGNLNDGQIIIDTSSKETVRLILNGVNMSCSNNLPIYIVNGKNIIIELAADTSNIISDKNAYEFSAGTEDEPWAAIFSKGNLTFTGTGSLTVNANYKHGIVSKDKLSVESGNITITAVADGMRGKDSITVYGGNLNITSGSDGMQANNDEDAEKGNITVKGGTLNITAGNDGIQAVSLLTIDAGTISIMTGGGSSNSIYGTSIPQAGWGSQNTTNSASSIGDSAKGLKAQTRIVINGCTLDINSSDDSIHANDTIAINNGDTTISSGDDAVHADKELEINGGTILIKKCFEGLESKIIRLNGGHIRLSSLDDGINIAGGSDGSSIGGRLGQNNFASTGNNYLYINGGYIYMVTTGDGIDVNGSVEMTAGTVIINGPTASNNGALDYDDTFKLTGGYIVAVGSSGMAQAPGTASTQYSLLLNFSSTYAAGTLVHIEDSSGNNILTFSPSKTFQSIAFTSSDLEKGATYKVYTGGNSTGTAVNGLYAGNSVYTAGNLYTSFTVSALTTSIGSTGGMPGMPGGGGRR